MLMNVNIKLTIMISCYIVFNIFVQVRYMKIIEKSGYQALPWVRYITQSGGKLLLVNLKLKTILFYLLPAWITEH